MVILFVYIPRFFKMAASNTLITNDIIAKLVLMEFKNNLVLAKSCNRQYQALFTNETGTTIRVRKPTRLLSAEGATLVTQPILQRTTPLTIDQRRHVGIDLTTEELTLQLNDFQANVIRPAMQRLANDVDTSIYNAAIGSIYNYVGTAGTAPASIGTVINADAKLNASGVPMKDRFCIMSENDGAILKTALYNTFNEKFNSKIILDSAMGNLAGFDFYTAQNVQRPLAASTSAYGTPVISGAGQSGPTLVISGVTSGMTFYAGQEFQIAGVNAVNPISLNDTTQLANFVVNTTTTAVGTTVTLPITQADGVTGIILTGPYQNVTVGPAANAAVTFQATHTKNIAYHKEAFTLAMINLYAPKETGAWARNMIDTDANIALRVVRQYNIGTDKDVVRVDALWGVRCFGEYATVIMGS
jgi:hypothetical protein